MTFNPKSISPFSAFKLRWVVWLITFPNWPECSPRIGASPFALWTGKGPPLGIAKHPSVSRVFPKHSITALVSQLTKGGEHWVEIQYYCNFKLPRNWVRNLCINMWGKSHREDYSTKFAWIQIVCTGGKSHDWNANIF
jgi:hypothetical protein